MAGLTATMRSIRREAAFARSDPANVRIGHWVAIAIILTGALDALSTDLALATGLALEANPLIRALQEATGDMWILVKMIVHGLLAAGVAWFPNRMTLIVMGGVAALVFAVSVNNFLIFADAMAAITAAAG